MDRRTAGRIGLALGVLLLVDTVRVYLPSVSNIFGVAAETSAYQLGGFAARRPLPTFPCDAPDQQIDQLLVRGLRADAIAVPAVGYSDHCPLAATLTIPRPTGAD